MIEINCDNCERSFGVEDSMAGGKVPCPMCGDVNRVPAAEGASAHAAVAVASASGSLPPPGDEETEIRVVRPAMLRAHPFRFLLVAALFAAGIGLSIYSMTETATAAAAEADAAAGGGRSWLLWPGLAMTAAGVGWWIIWWVVATLWIKVTITNKRTIRHEGLVRRHSTEVLHDHVRSVDIHQGFVQRLFRVGYIGIDSAGQDGIEIEIRDIPGPYEIKAIIDQYRRM